MNKVEKLMAKISGILVLTFVLACLLPAGAFAEAKINITPKLIVGYGGNTNVDATYRDSDDDPVSITYMNYLLGLEGTIDGANQSVGADAKAGYQQYLTIDGDLEEDADADASDYSYFLVKGAVWYKARQNRVSLMLRDEITRNRNLGEVYGAGTSSMSYRYLYLQNIASVHVTVIPIDNLNVLAGYEYSTLTFYESENENLENTTPADTYEHRGIARAEYNLNSKATVFADGQYGQKVYSDVERTFMEDRNNDGIPEVYEDDFTVTDTTVVQGMIGLRYRFTPKSTLEVAGGAAQRRFYDEPDDLDLEDTVDPLARITYIFESSKKLMFKAGAEQGISVYSQNSQYIYSALRGEARYYPIEDFYVQANGSFIRNVYDVQKNDREDIWDHDRIDDIYSYGGKLHWDVLKQRQRAWLMLEAEYTRKSRYSNLRDEDDYDSTYAAAFNNDIDAVYDTDVDLYLIQVIVVPTFYLNP